MLPDDDDEDDDADGVLELFDESDDELVDDPLSDDVESDELDDFEPVDEPLRLSVL